MKAKYFLIYVVVGAAFLAVSLWVFLSGGNNPKAIHAKYKLGGILLIAWSIIATASCEKGPLSKIGGAIDGGEVMCYDPAPSDWVSFTTDRYDQQQGHYFLAPGKYLTIHIEGPTFKEYRVAINKRIPEKEGDEAFGDLLQAEVLVADMDAYSNQHRILYAPADEDYTGQAIVSVYGLSEGDDTGNRIFWQWNLFITGGDED